MRTQAKQQKQNNNLLLLACTRGYCADAQHLVKTGADISAHDKQGFRALHFAAAHGHLDVVTFLWSKGAEVDWETPDGRSPLHLAALRGHSTVVKFLLSKQAWADSQDAEDSTALHLAARGASQQTISELLKVSASTHITNKLGLTPLAEAVVSGQVDSARLLLGKEAEGLRHRPQGWSLLHLACATGQPDCAALLIKHGAEVQDMEKGSGLTPLHAAAMSGNVDCVRMLLAAKASVSAPSIDGSLPGDLVPPDSPDRPQLLVLLKSAAAGKRKRRAVPREPSASPVDSSDLPGPPLVQAFTALNKTQQLSRVERWAQKGPADPQVVAELKGFWSEVKKRLEEAHRTMMMLALHKVLMMLHSDEGYQKDVGDPKAMDTVLSELKQHPDRLSRYKTDPAKSSVFKKIELFQMVLKATDQRGKVPWQATLVPKGDPDWKEQDETRKHQLEMKLEIQKEAVVAAALAGSEDNAAQAADAAADDSRQLLIQSQQQQQQQQQSPASASTTTQSNTQGRPTTAAPTQVTAGTAKPSSSEAATTAGKPPAGPHASAVSSTDRKGVSEAVKGPAQRQPNRGTSPAEGGGLTTQQENASARARRLPQEDDDMPQILSYKEVVYGYRYLMIGYAIMLLFLFLWLSYMTGPMNRKQNHQDSMRADEL
ncbi:hypothetical protein ABBQ32_009843 [Trebouxia sp. C0010 RCD-2024]